MGAGHDHGAGQDAGSLRLQRLPKVLLIVLVVLCGLAAGAAMLHWSPDSTRTEAVQGRVPFLAKGVRIVHGQLLRVQPICSSDARAAPALSCGDSRVKVLDGVNAGQSFPLQLTPDVTGTGLRAGDRVLLFDSSLAAAPGVGAGSSDFAFYRADRAPSMLWLAILFAVLVVVVAVRRGLMALLSLAFAGLVVAGYLIPALLSGRPAIPVTLAAAVLILIVMLYATHGISMRTTVALVGALVGIGLATLFGWVGIVGTRIGGLADEAAGILTFNVAWIHVQQLVVASVILASIGTLNDVTVTQVSALWELRAAAPTMTRWQLFRSAMRIGRDHVASTVYTLVFAYLGTALVLLIAVQLYGGGPIDFLTAEDVAEEIVRALVGGIALVLTMPVTTAIGALVAAHATPTEPPAPPVRPRRERQPMPEVRLLPAAGTPIRQSHYRQLPEDPWTSDPWHRD